MVVNDVVNDDFVFVVAKDYPFRVLICILLACWAARASLFNRDYHAFCDN